MMTNKYAQECKDCGEMVRPGKGILTNEWSNQDDDTVWVVRHSDKSICQAVHADRENDAKCADIIGAIINYIKAYGKRSEIKDGSDVVYDGRKGYNFVGWLITRDSDNTIYLTSRNNLDGFDGSEAYILTDNDDGFGNSNNDIIKALRDAVNGKPSDIKPFAI